MGGQAMTAFTPPEFFDVDETGASLVARCLLCGWATSHNRSDRDRFRHSLSVHAWNFCPPRKT
jgi:hypothetical protein